MKKIQCLSGDYDAGVEVEKSEMFNAAMLTVDEGGKSNTIYLGKAEVQQLIDQLEKLKKDIL